MSARQHKAAKFSAKQEYLLSGKIFCGECGSSFAGNSRRPDARHPLYVSYKCTRHNQRDEKCRNPEINREKVEGAVIKKLSSVIFNPNVIPALVREYNDYIAQKSGSAKSTLDTLKKELASVDNKISKTVDLMIETGSAAMKAKLADRFGPVPDELLRLFDIVRIRQLGQKLGFEKIIIKNGVMIAFFISNPLSQYSRSDMFSRILENVSLNPKLFELKQNDNKLRVFSKNVDGLSAAYSLLKKL
jgi:hypothetical protein